MSNVGAGTQEAAEAVDRHNSRSAASSLIRDNAASSRSGTSEPRFCASCSSRAQRSSEGQRINTADEHAWPVIAKLHSVRLDPRSPHTLAPVVRLACLPFTLLRRLKIAQQLGSDRYPRWGDCIARGAHKARGPILPPWD
jgi:hypothetical protein